MSAIVDAMKAEKPRREDAMALDKLDQFLVEIRRAMESRSSDRPEYSETISSESQRLHNSE